MEHINPRYLQAIDAKGRLQLTREIRSEFRLKKGDKLYLLPSPGKQPHLQIRTAAQWKLFMDEFLQQTPSGAKRDYRRFVELESGAAVRLGDRDPEPAELRHLREYRGVVSELVLDQPPHRLDG